MTQREQEIASKIRRIALISSKFKIGKTGLGESQRLSLHPNYRRIVSISWSKNKETIEKLESMMIDKFFNWKNNDNRNKGSAGRMGDSVKYVLYVVYTKKRKTIVRKKR